MIISIMPDFGNAPYAWLKNDDVPYPAVGPNFIDSSAEGWPDEYPVSQELHKAFSEWAIYFEHNSLNDDFDWETFHKKGLELSIRLNEQIGHLAKVYYVKPHEDPGFNINRQTLIQ